MIVTIDFETASEADLPTVGAYRYWADPTTEVLCLCWQTDTGQIGRWQPGDPGGYLQHVLCRDGTFEAHNAQFEIEGWSQHMVALYGFPPMPNDRWRDTMAACAYKAIPLALEKAAKALDLGARKDTAGSMFVKRLSKADKLGVYRRDTAAMDRVLDYCHQDCAVEAELSGKVGPLPDSEQAVWQMDLAINQRGVRLDIPYIQAARFIVDQASRELEEEFHSITGVKPTQVLKALAWVQAAGVPLPDLTKGTLAAVLGTPADEEDDEDQSEEADPTLADLARTLPPQVRRALELRALVGSASIKKLPRMLACLGPDGRTRGLLQYHGATTGRWAARLWQPHNLPRGTIYIDGKPPTPAQMVSAIMTRNPGHVARVLGDPIQVVLSGLRHAIIPDPGSVLVVGDYAGIEARVVLSLAGQHDKTALMASGVDVYCDMASTIYGRPITKANAHERTIGKNSVLGCGFGMGWKKFRERYGQVLTEQVCRDVIDTYRQDWAPQVPMLWRGLEEAALRAVTTGKPAEAFGVEYRMEDGWLSARLPSGRKIWYFNPRVSVQPVPWDPEEMRTTWTYQATKQGKWLTITAYGGLLTENVVQALARDLMVDAMFKCHAQNIPIILTVHDEIIGEPRIGVADDKTLAQIMADRPAWAVEMKVPVLAECWMGDRYKKG